MNASSDHSEHFRKVRVNTRQIASGAVYITRQSTRVSIDPSPPTPSSQFPFAIADTTSARSTMAPTSRAVTHEANPPRLPPRYEIRRLEPKHADWAAAIVIQTNIYESTLWPHLYTDRKTRAEKYLAAMKAANYLVMHQISSGWSFGVFDLEYEYKNESSKATEGAYLGNTLGDEPTREEILDAMDFPLVSVALAYDGIDKLDLDQLSEMFAVLPPFPIVYHHLDLLDPRGDAWRATERNQILMRNATSTRPEYEKKGIMGALARFLMREAQLKGYKAINIECVNDAVTHVWSNPKQEGMSGEITSKFWSEDCQEKDENGEMYYVLRPAKQLITRVHTTVNA